MIFLVIIRTVKNDKKSKCIFPGADRPQYLLRVRVEAGMDQV